MGCSCVGERNLKPIPEKQPDPKSKQETKKKRRSREPTRKTTKAIITPQTFGWKATRMLLGSISDLYTAGKVLRNEETSKLFTATHKATNQPCVIEEFSKAEYTRIDKSSGNPKEWEFTRNLDHPNILHPLEFLEDENSLFAVFENFACTLEESLERMKELHVVARIMMQIMRALQYTHRIGVVHKNLNLSNIALKESNLENPTVKLLRFGGPPETHHKKELKKLPIFHYFAPELLMGVESDKNDIWSCGIIMYVLITGLTSLPKVHTQALKFPKAFQSEHPDVFELVKQMLSRDPVARPSAEEFIRHPWIKQFDQQMSYKSRPVRLALTQLCNQKPRSVLKEAIMTFMLNRIYSQKQLANMAEIFRAIDTDEDGRLTREDLAETLRKVMPGTMAEQSVDDIMFKTDLDGNGYITYSEFLLAGIEEREIFSSENTTKAFESLDKDHSGTISIDELKEAFFINRPREQVSFIWKSIISKVDTSGNGQLEFREFEAICSKILKS